MSNRNIVRFIWTICFLVGASTHARDIWAGGWLPYDYAPLAVNFFWTLLLPLDLLAALILWAKPKLGASLGLAIMISDVAVNSWMQFALGISMGYALWLQIAFLLFILATCKIVMQEGA
ncbi:hypothetical protein ACFOWX_01140 [Sphingorhabdus arenilitoris]|uniref:Tryptophan-rich sensory protein n=1 Tax=Sphingorhabdus arenilitoris TaxID=1490041 RepID=A0ABV8REA1_9SPHN